MSHQTQNGTAHTGHRTEQELNLGGILDAETQKAALETTIGAAGL